MPIVSFPPLETADEHGLLALGGDLSPESLVLAYQSGVFPWPINEDYPLAWFSPDPRGIIEYADRHIPRSLMKTLRKQKFKVSFNQCFEVVIHNCQRVVRKKQSNTWITKELLEAYIELHRQGYAYSCEVWDQEGELAGGLYGVCIGSFSSGESMFHRCNGASKLAVLATLSNLRDNDVSWLDTQMTTPVVSSLGGREIERSEFVRRLQSARNFSIRFPNKTCEWEDFL